MADLGDLTPNDVKRIMDSATVRRLSRIFSIALLPAIGFVGGYFLLIDHRVGMIEIDRAGIESKIIGLQSDMSSVKLGVSQTAIDVAKIKGMIEISTGKDVAALNGLFDHQQPRAMAAR